MSEIVWFGNLFVDKSAAYVSSCEGCCTADVPHAMRETGRVDCMVADDCELEKRWSHLLRFWATRRRMFLSRKQVKAQVGHSNFEHDKDNSPDFLAIVTGPEGAFLYMRLGSQHFLYYPGDGK